MRRVGMWSVLLAAACSDGGTDTEDVDSGADSDTDAEVVTGACGTTEQVGASEASHEKTDANYDILMGDGAVPRLDIVICPDDYTVMQDDLADILGSGGGGPGGNFSDETPVYIPVTLSYDGQVWPKVGMRYKGNSSLFGARSGKLPFRLQIDEFEDDYPDLDNQRFYGFKDLKFSSAYNDDSFQRDKLTSDTFRAAGVPAARGGFVRIYVDTGEGSEYWGLYSVFEDPAGELLDSWFADDDGNMYKPDGDDAALNGGVDPDVFEKKTNEDEADYSDVEAFVTALQADRTDAAAWRAGLEATFDVDGFVRYLAVNNLVGNWDAYGRMTHNYYLYGDSDQDGRLVWIPWDFNEAYAAGRGQRSGIDVDLGNIESGWPLLEYLASDPIYRAQYDAELTELLTSVFSADEQDGRITANAARISEWADAETSEYTNSGGGFDAATTELTTHVRSQRSDAASYLD